MNTTRISLYFLLATGLLLMSCAPVAINNIYPNHGLPGTIIEIQGRGFNPDPFKNTVAISGYPARVISGNSNTLRVVALREFDSGKVEVKVNGNTATSAQIFKRQGSTTMATPLKDSDPELIVGKGFDVDSLYDMHAQGLNQKILVVLVTPSDIDPEDLAPAGKTARESVIERLDAANEYFLQASYGLISADFTVIPDWITLSQPRDFYCWQQDDIDREQTQVDAAQAALDALLLNPSATPDEIEEAEDELEEAEAALRAAKNARNLLQEKNFLFGEAFTEAKISDPVVFDDVDDYLVIVAGPFLRGQNFGAQSGYHAESTNPMIDLRFDIDFDGMKGVTYVAQQANWGRIVHELSHFFAIGDIYEFGYADGSKLEGAAAPFAMMGSHDSHPLYIGYDIEKKLDYFDESTNGNVKFLEWGSVADIDETYNLIAHAKTQDPVGDDTYHLLRLKVTEGLYYFVEVRQQPDPTIGLAADYVFDPNIPLDTSNPAWKGGVIIYKAVENGNQSNNKERPVNLLPPQRMLQVGDAFADPLRTIRISVTEQTQNRPAKYRVRVEWGHLPSPDPDGQFDLRITPWSPPPWETEAIWVNSIKNDETAPPRIIYKNHIAGDETIPIGNGDPPWVGHDNTIFAEIRNEGVIDTPAPVLVTFYVNSPPGIGDDGTWAPFDVVDAGIMTAGEVKTIQAARKWRPSVGEHTCIKVEIHPMTGEVTFDNNSAQENLSEFETGAASPYKPVEFDFIARNPYTVPIVMDLQARQVPQDWFVAFEHGSVWLAPHGDKKVHTVIWTDRTAEWEGDKQRRAPRKPLINIEGWADRWSDKVFAVGGVTVFVQAVREVDFRIEVGSEGKVDQPFVVTGNVLPSTGVAAIAVHIIDPDGRRISERTTTDASGLLNYETSYRAKMPGKYFFQAFVIRGGLAAETDSNVVEVEIR